MDASGEQAARNFLIRTGVPAALGRPRRVPRLWLLFAGQSQSPLSERFSQEARPCAATFFGNVRGGRPPGCRDLSRHVELSFRRRRQQCRVERCVIPTGLFINLKFRIVRAADQITRHFSINYRLRSTGEPCCVLCCSPTMEGDGNIECELTVSAI